MKQRRVVVLGFAMCVVASRGSVARVARLEPAIVFKA